VSGAAVVLFTHGYPWEGAAESVFLTPEVKCLAAVFERVIVVPANLGPDRATLPEGVELDESYSRLRAGRLNLRTLARALGSPLLYAEMRDHPEVARQRAGLGRMVRAAGAEAATRRWMKGFPERWGLDPARTVYYTYWLGPSTLGVAAAAERWGGAAVVSRAHGYDLYLERHAPPHIPFFARTVDSIDALFTVSEHGRRYVEERHPSRRSTVEVQRLGTTEGAGLNEPSRDGVLRLASCSFLRPVKRIDLLARGVACAARQRPDLLVRWNHLGGGPEEERLEREVHASMPANVRFDLAGTVDNERVRRFYETTPVDVFVNVSRSEGVPVSIMEAQSYGIPVVATAVGGSPEIVSARNGVLLEADPTPERIAEALLEFAPGGPPPAARRAASRSTWAALSDAEVNFPRFAARLRALADVP
jgi:colanic acid/amylovoran biosynthesis glycosyltransferase